MSSVDSVHFGAVKAGRRYVGCIAGALSRTEYPDGLAAVGFINAVVVFTHQAAPGRFVLRNSTTVT